MKVALFAMLLIALAGASAAPSRAAATDDNCAGHKLLPAPREESSCQILSPRVFSSPDGAARALVFPEDASLDATPDMESRVVFRGKDGKLLNSRNFASPRGFEGYYVVNGQWSPDSRFFVFTLSSSGGHSPWSFPTWVFGRDKNVIVDFARLIDGNPTVSPDFAFAGPHTLKAMTWEKSGSEKHIAVTVDLTNAMKDISESP
jgi:hypothetical protein